MSEQYIGEIRSFSFGFAPQGWHSCDGSILPIMQNQALFSILGTTYGGDGRTTFALPDLRGRVPVHSNKAIPLGASAGEEAHTLTVNEMPSHIHLVNANNTTGTAQTSTDNVWANSGAIHSYSPKMATPMSSNALTMAGNSQPHSNMQPYTVLNYCIAVTGIFPSRN